MDWPLIALLDNVLLQVQTSFPQRVLFRGDGAGGISSYVAGWTAGKGMGVILIDGANHFNPYMVSSFARRALIPPERLLRRIRIARAFTCYQMATLMGERLWSFLKEEEEKSWVIILGPMTTFLDEDVPEREVRSLFERALKRVGEMAGEGIPFFLFQPNSPGFPLVRRGRGGGMESRRSYLTKRLFQFSDLVWRTDLEDQGPRLILEKGLELNIIENCKLQNGNLCPYLPVSGRKIL